MKIELDKVKISEGIRWISETDCLKIMKGDKPSITVIRYPEAVLWDLIFQHYSSARMLEILAAFKKESKDKLAVWVESTIHDWIHKGIVTL